MSKTRHATSNSELITELINIYTVHLFKMLIAVIIKSVGVTLNSVTNLNTMWYMSINNT